MLQALTILCFSELGLFQEKKKKERKKKQQAKSCLIIRKESTRYQLKILVLIRLNRKKKQAFDGLKNKKPVLVFLRE